MDAITIGHTGAGTADDAGSCDGTDKSTWQEEKAPVDGASRAPTGAGEVQQQAPLQPLYWRRSWRPLLSRRKPISSHMAGTGTFIVEYEGPSRDCNERPAYLRLPAAEQELMLQDTYKAVLAMCEAMVPGNGLELMDALMETTDVYRKRYGYKKNLFDLDGQGKGEGKGDDGDCGGGEEEEELVRLTPTFGSLGGSFWLEKDRFFRRRRSCFAQLARSQRARVIKATYELIQAVGEEFSPGTRLDLLDRVFGHHTALRPVQQKDRREAPQGVSHPAPKRARSNEGHALPSLALGLFSPADPLVVAAAHVLAAHWARVMGGSVAQAPMDGGAIPPQPPLILPTAPLQLLQPMMQHWPSGSMGPSHPTSAATWPGARHPFPPQGSPHAPTMPATVGAAQNDGNTEPSSLSQLVAAVDTAHP